MNKYKNRRFLLKFLFLIIICIIMFAHITNLENISKKCKNYIKYSQSHKHYFNTFIKKIVSIMNFFVCESKKLINELTKF